ncbi:hypothetical protein [Sporomusa termitida]|uniref:Uncharacterized protein n=1 Tax=Sporomusa termitida TaxID=2377 RepID=A0A517DTD0_9FIRM|nr:hypothetical protein [Sporomusa termitida]QDR80610.1 hypothetical protein SPTER_19390 [Sporomusa termitida]
MNIEIRKNGTFYLKDSIYNPVTKLPKNTSIYLGSNPLQAKQKLKTLTDDAALLNQIPDTLPYEIELDKAIKNLQKLNGLQTNGVTRLVKEYLAGLLQARLLIATARAGMVAPTVECRDCRYKQGNHCDHFDSEFINGNGKYKDGNPVRCVAYEAGRARPGNGLIKLPRDFRER